VDLALTPGVDPFDAMLGGRVPAFVRGNARTRQFVIQVRKRTPVDLAGPLGVRPFLMAKALGCFLAAEAREHLCGDSEAASRAAAIADALPRTGGAAGLGAWGYEFDVQTRWGFYAAGTPNLIATVFVGRGYLEAGLTFGKGEWLDEAVAAARHLVDVHLTRASGRTYFLYTPDNSTLVHNANLLGAGFVSAVGAVADEPGLLEIGREACFESLDAMSEAGAWPYGEGRGLGWDDNFHTAYDLDGLSWVGLSAVSEDPELEASLGVASSSWDSAFFGPSGEPRYYRERPFPYDIHSAATAVDVACRLAMRGAEAPDALRTFKWASENLIDRKTGLTYYQKHRGFTDRRNFRRWGDAHWALARSAHRLSALGIVAPVEAAMMRRRHDG
jgi:hypothetical protein